MPCSLDKMVPPPRPIAIQPSRYLLQCQDRILVQYARPDTKLPRSLLRACRGQVLRRWSRIEDTRRCRHPEVPMGHWRHLALAANGVNVRRWNRCDRSVPLVDCWSWHDYYLVLHCWQIETYERAGFGLFFFCPWHLIYPRWAFVFDKVGSYIPR